MAALGQTVTSPSIYPYHIQEEFYKGGIHIRFQRQKNMYTKNMGIITEKTMCSVTM
jgi:hypothetical protein